LARVPHRTAALGATESYVYDGNGNLVQSTDRRGKVTALQGCAQSTKFKEIEMAANALPQTVTRLIAENNLSGMELLLIETGKKAEVDHDAVGESIHFAYNGGDLAPVTDALGNTSNLAHDAAGRLQAAEVLFPQPARPQPGPRRPLSPGMEAEPSGRAP
jgi:YD repeat-containing protein